jgi:RHS repeat-associated protein
LAGDLRTRRRARRRGRPVRWNDRNGNALTIAYRFAADATVADSALLWEVASVTDAYGRKAAFTYAASPRAGFYPVVRIDVPGGRSIGYRYDGASLLGLSGVDLPDGTSSWFSLRQDAVTQCQVLSFFDAAAKPLERRRDVYLTNGAWLNPATGMIEAVSANRVRMVVNGAGEVSYLNWATMTPQFEQQTYVYEGGHSLFRFTSFLGAPMGREWASRWNLDTAPSAWNWELSAAFRTNALKFTTVRADGHGRPTADAFDPAAATRPGVTYPDGAATSTDYDAFRQPTRIVDELGRVTLCVYDARGNLVSRTVAAGTADASTWAWTVNSRGQPTSMTDPNGHTTEYAFDAIGQLTNITDPPDTAGAPRAQWRFGYDAIGNRTSVTDPDGRLVSTVYDARNRATLKTFGDGSTEASTYGSGTDANLIVATSDRNGHRTTLAYDGEGREITRTVAVGTPAQGITTTSYLQGTSLPAVRTAYGDTTEYTYDHQDRLIATTVHPDAAHALTRSDTLDADGERVVTTDPYGRRTARAFDARGRVVRQVVELVPGALASPTQLVADVMDPSLSPWSFRDLGGPALAGSVSVAGDAITISGVGVEMWSDTEQFSLYDQELTGDGSITARVASQDATDPWAKAGVMLRTADVVGSAYAALFVSPGYGVSVNDRAAQGLDTTYEPVAPLAAGIRWLRLERSGTSIRSYTSTDGATWALGHEGTVGFGVTVRIGLFVLAHEAATPCTAVFDHVRVERAPTQSEAVVLALIERDVRALDRTNPELVITDTAYDASGAIVAKVDGRGIVTTFAYDQQGRRTSLTEAAGTADAATFTTAYDPAGNLIESRSPRQVLDPSLGSTRQTFTARNLPATRTEAAGNPLAATRSITYTLTKKPATRTDALGRTTVFQYGACCDRLVGVVDPLGAITTYGYDSVGNRTSVVDANGLSTVIEFDARDRIQLSTNAAGEATAYAYSDDASALAIAAGLGFGPGADGSASTVTDPLGDVRIELHDGIGRTVRRVDPLAHATTTTFDAVVPDGGVALVEAVTVDALGHATSVRGDALARVRVSIDALGKRSVSAYDADGNVVRFRDANGVGHDCVYDQRNRKTTCVDTAGAATAWQYDADGEIIRQSDALGAATTMSYDALDRKIATADRIGATTSMGYDAAGNLVRIADAEGRVTTSAYDVRDLLVGETFPPPSGGTRTYAYDSGRRLARRVDQLGVVTVYSYDAANRLTRRSYSSGAGADDFAYDHAGRLTAAHSGRYADDIARSYDADGRLVAERLSLDGIDFPVALGYDSADRLTGLVYPSGSMVARSYSARDELVEVSLAGFLTAHRAYDDGGRLIQTDYGNGLSEHRAYVPGDDLPATIVTPAPTASGPVERLDYAYDADKRMLAQTDGAFAAASQGFAYDAEGRLTSWVGGSSTQSWSLSPVGDWTSTTRDGATQVRTHAAAHEISSIDHAPVLSDAKGNVVFTTSPIALYAWDDENRLARAIGVGPHGLFNASYRYDALGRRVQKRVDGETTTWISAVAQEVVEIIGDPARAPWLDPHADLSPAVTGVGPEGSLLQQAGAMHIDFRPDAAGAHDGWIVDTGDLPDPSSSPQHGWDRKRPALDRDFLDQPEWDTFVRMMPGSSVGAWSMPLADGSYPLVIIMGDAMSRDQTNTITVNGVEIDDPTPAEHGQHGYEQGAFDGYVTQVTVTGGRLTIAPVRRLAQDPKLCFIEIGPQGGTIDAATRERVANAVQRMTAATASRRGKNAVAREFAYGTYVDEPLLMLGDGGRRYLHADRLHSIVATTGAAGEVVERFRYDVYGMRSVASGSGATLPASPTRQGYGFTGRRHDDETGLQYFNARYYSPALGRFIGRDPCEIRPRAAIESMGVFGDQFMYVASFAKWAQPMAGDGYQDGANLYAAYFVPNATDPRGLATKVDDCSVRVVVEHGSHDANDVYIPQKWKFGKCSAGAHLGCGAGVTNAAFPAANQIKDGPNDSAGDFSGAVTNGDKVFIDMFNNLLTRNGYADKAAELLCAGGCKCAKIKVYIESNLTGTVPPIDGKGVTPGGRTSNLGYSGTFDPERTFNCPPPNGTGTGWTYP